MFMSSEKYCLGIETTAHTFSCSVVNFSGETYPETHLQ